MTERLRKHFWYWILPSVTILVMMLVYFLDLGGLSYVIAPNLNREFGLLEHVQLAIILAVIVVAFKKALSSDIRLEKVFYTGVALFSVFIFLEEMDYGIHYYEYFQTGTIAENSTGEFDGVRNIHNQGRVRQWTMLVVYIAFVTLLGILALLKDRLFKRNALAQWLIPSSGYFVLSLTAMMLLNELAHYLNSNFKDPSITALNGNKIEFQETFIYYIAFLYIWELTRKPFPFHKDKSVSANQEATLSIAPDIPE